MGVLLVNVKTSPNYHYENLLSFSFDSFRSDLAWINGFSQNNKK